MNKVIQELILFLVSFIVIFLLYQFFIIKKAKKKSKDPIEVTYLVNKYKLDLEKVSYKRLLNVISIVSALDIALVVSIIVLLKSFILEMIVGFISTLVIILASYHLVYLVYKKKGMIKNEHKRNRS